MECEMAKKITIDQIAKIMNVSKSTVSVALSDKYGIGEQLRSAIVLKAIELGYDFTKLRKRNYVDIYVPNSDCISKSTFWAEVLKGIESRLNHQKFSVNILCQYEGDLEKSIVSTQAKAVVLINPKAEVLRTASKAQVPVVILDASDNVCFEFDHVLTDNFSGGYLAAEHLFQNGHRRILISGNTNYSYSFFQRKAGFEYYFNRQKCYNAKIYSEPISEEERLFDLEFAMRKIKNRQVTAVMCLNDPIAIQLYPKVKELGFSVPEDLSFIGFDDDSQIFKSFPRLTTIRVSKSKMGEVAAETIMERINRGNKPIETIELHVMMVNRLSVKNLNKNKVLASCSERGV